MRNQAMIFGATVAAVVALNCAGAVPATASGGGLTARSSTRIAGLQSPEDLELLPDGKRILISEMAGEKDQPGQFALLDVTNLQVTVLHPEAPTRSDWGDPGCKQRDAAQISPHGIHLSRTRGGGMLLLAINHGKMESVHAYALLQQGAKVRLMWRGCVETPYNFNDVAATPDGFIGAHQFDKPMGEGSDATKFLFGGSNTGVAVRWSRATGFRKIPGTEAAFPNGITVSKDGTTAWMAATAGRQVRKIDLVRNLQVAAADLPIAPDNLSWTADGQLLVTGPNDVLLLAKCAAMTPPCTVPFSVVRLDPDTLASHAIYQNDGAQLLGASVAIIAGSKMYLGSFAGDHILQVPAPAFASRHPLPRAQ